MKKSILVVLDLLFISCLPILSQQYNRPPNILISDFNSTKQQPPTVLFYKTLITFPYREEYGEAGALDKFFGLDLKSFIRISIKRNDSCHRIIVFPKIYDKEPNLKSIRYYYLKDNSIATRKVNDSEVIMTSDAFAHYIDFSKIIKDNQAIIDVDISNSSSEPYYKQKLLLYLDKNIIYRDYSAQIYIPDIYFFDKNFPEACFSLNIKTDILGPRIGYRSTRVPSETITPKVLVDMFSEKFGTKYDQVYCKLTLLTLIKDSACDMIFYSSPIEIFNYNLNKIVERK
jgi:hypothetical protein